jgi:glycosyltransferase involved in cell wall biosynthesis
MGLKISVCLAAYNGAQYIESQAKSILTQLEAEDELIICDDNSTDNTLELLKNLQDSRIKIYESNENIGHLKNFEKVLGLANGDVIFLSDQDDVWVSNKVSEIKAIFLQHPDVTLIQHAVALMDEKGTIFNKHWRILKEGIQNKHLFLFKQLIRGQIQGSAMAFRAHNLPLALPFPANTYGHDDWLGIFHGVVGKIYFLNKPLINYRRHGNAYTVQNKLSYLNKIRVRWIELTHIFQVLCRRLSINR